MEVYSRSYSWKGLIASVIMTPLLILCLIGVYSEAGATGKMPVYIALMVMLTLAVWAFCKSVKQLRNRSRDE